MKRVTRHVCMLLLLLSLVVMASSVAFAQIGPDIPREETLIVDILSGRIPNPKRFNAWAPGTNTDAGIQQCMLDPLWCVEYAQGEILNVLAKSPPIYNEDHTQMKVELREGIYWSDGVQFTADDVIFTVEKLKANPGMNYSTEFDLGVDKVYKTDDYTVIFELKSPNARFHTYFLDRWGSCRIMAKHVWEDIEDPMTFDAYPPVSIGQYVLKEVDPGGYWFLWERREDWQRTAVGQMYGKPKPKYVLFHYYGPPEKKVMAQARHELDMCDLTMETLQASLDRPDFRTYRRDYPWIVNIDPCITGITLNTAKAPFDNRDVRWALVLCMDIVDVMAMAFDCAGAMGALHVPPNPVYLDWYYAPMEGWLNEFTLDIEIDGKPFKPYDPEASQRLADYAKGRGYAVPDDPAQVREIFGYGWWKCAPEVAGKLLERNGYTKDKSGKWLLPDGKPWKITLTSNANPSHPGYKNVFAVAQQWRRFGIEIEVATSEQAGTLSSYGQVDASNNWPAYEPWGGHPDLHRTLRMWHSKYVKPIGDNAVGHHSRWSHPELDVIIDEMEKIGFDDPKLMELGMEGLKITAREMPSIPTFSYPGVVGWDETYWTNYPGAENPYQQPYQHWPNFKFMLPFLEPTGKK
ncbi:MAG: ABC transporter substrate-binding protein [Firmicutes bacterium]|nr:ABC transporter substrate-binding protein [Bacillota bacterium]